MYDKTKTFDRAEEELYKKPKKTKKMVYQKLFMNQAKEIMYFIMKDGSIRNITSEKRDSINGKINIKIKDIETVIHNHRTNRRFSKDDEDFYSHLLGKGFKGNFKLFCKGITYDLNKGNLNGKHENDNQ